MRSTSSRSLGIELLANKLLSVTTDPPPPRAPSPMMPLPDGNPPRKATDNPIAVAGILISLLGVIASVVVLGGLLGLVGLILSAIGFRRSKGVAGRGKGAAIGGIALGLFAILASVGFFFLYFSRAGGGPAIVRDGIATHSTNTEFPPQDDLVEVTCAGSGSSALATVELTNMSPGPSIYVVTVGWDTPAGDFIDDVVQSELIDPGDSVSLRLFDETRTAVADTCKVTTIERTGLGFLNN